MGLIWNSPSAFGGYTLFGRCRSEPRYLIDSQGRIVHKWERNSHAKLLESGNLLTRGGNRILEVNPEEDVIWKFEHRSHHDFMKLPNGNVLLLANETRTREEAIAAGANPDLVEDNGILVDYIVEIRPAGPSGGEVVWEWRIWDHLVQDYDPGKANYGDVAQSPELIDINFTLGEVFNEPKDYITQRPGMDWSHANSLDYNPELDQIMLSPRNFSEVWIIDHSTTREEAAGHTGGNSGKGGDLLYRWGNPRAYRAGTASDQQLFWQHQPHWIPQGLPRGATS